MSVPVLRDGVEIRGYATLPYRAAAQINRRYTGIRGSQLRRNPALDEWLEAAVILLRKGGVGPAPGAMDTYRTQVYMRVSTRKLDCAAFEKAVIDAVAVALFGRQRDRRGHAIYPDDWVGSVWAEKRWVSTKVAERLEVWAAATPLPGGPEDDRRKVFNFMASTSEALRLMGFDYPGGL